MSAANAHTHDHHDGEVHAHVAPWQFMLGILVVLLLMTVLTVYTARYVDAGEIGNLVIAIAIATFKAALVVGFFMHLHWDNKFNAVALLVCLLAIATFMLFSLIDLGSRGRVDPLQTQTIAPEVAKAARDRAVAEGRLVVDEHGNYRPAGEQPHGDEHPAPAGAH